MNPDLKHLIRLQAIDSASEEIQSRIQKFPGISKALDDKLLHARTALETAREKLKTNASNRKKAEMEVGTLEAKISKYRDQMMSVKTNTEYRAMQSEIEHTQTAIRKVEDDILNMMIEAEMIEAEIKAAEARLKQDQENVNQERRQLEAVHQQDVSALEAYRAERQEIVAALSSSELAARYDRVRKARNGIAVAAARDYVCEVCQVRIRPQVYAEILRNDRIIPCDACQRILYSPDNLDHPFEVA